MTQDVNNTQNNNTDQTLIAAGLLSQQPVTLSVATPEYSYSPLTRRYRDISTGKFVKATEVRAAVDQVILGAKASIQDLALSLQAGKLTLAEWQVQTAQALKTLHVASAVAANGGFANMSQADYGFTGNLIKQQYQFLQQFANDIASGKQKLDGTLLNRVNLYVEAARGTFEDMARRVAKIGGLTEERRILGPADHCSDCTTDANKSWQPIGTLPRIGDSICLSNCHCTFDFR